MKLVRYGEAGKEKPGIIDAQGGIRDLSGVVKDIDGSLSSPRRLCRPGFYLMIGDAIDSIMMLTQAGLPDAIARSIAAGSAATSSIISPYPPRAVTPWS